MNQSPAISVVLPVYNAEAYVREAVESILAQSFTDFELIAINDGSTDDIGAILRELAARDTRIVLGQLLTHHGQRWRHYSIV